MTQRQIIQLIGYIIGVIILTNLPFLPGPQFLNIPAQLFYYGGQFIGMFGLLIIPILMIRTVSEFRSLENKYRFNSILIVVLLFAALLSTIFISKQARDLSRSYVIKRAEKMIVEIEAFKEAQGFYPDSLAVLGAEIPNPGIIGISNYYYQKDSDCFVITFHQNVMLNFNYEIVTYNKMDRHAVNGETKELYETGFAHWKYEIFD